MVQSPLVEIASRSRLDPPGGPTLCMPRRDLPVSKEQSTYPKVDATTRTLADSLEERPPATLDTCECVTETF